MTAILTPTDRKRQDRSVRRTEKRGRRAELLQFFSPIHPHPSVPATTDDAWKADHLILRQNQVNFLSNGTPLGEFRLTDTPGSACALLLPMTLLYAVKSPGGRAGMLSGYVFWVVALVGAALQCLFAYREVAGWNVGFVAKAAPAWVDHLPAEKVPPKVVEHIHWAQQLAFNMGVYNLVLALGLVWVLVAGAAVAGTLGIFLAVWLLIAAAAAARSGVPLAFKVQGGLGVVLMIASIWAWRDWLAAAALTAG